jgi:hypothetical protein
MITCPLCNAQLNMSYYYDHPGDFSCPTTVSGVLNHYHRNSLPGLEPEHIIHVPPFHLSWLEDCHDLRIYSEQSKNNSVWKFVKNIPFEEVVVWAKKLQNLKAFV